MIGKVEPSISVLANAVLASVLVLTPLEPCMAQSWLPWGGNFFDAPPRYYAPPGYRERAPRRDDRRKSSTRENKVRLVDTVKDGGLNRKSRRRHRLSWRFRIHFESGQSSSTPAVASSTSSSKRGAPTRIRLPLGVRASAGRGPRRSAASRLGPIGILPPRCGHVMRACLRR